MSVIVPEHIQPACQGFVQAHLPSRGPVHTRLSPFWDLPRGWVGWGASRIRTIAWCVAASLWCLACFTGHARAQEPTAPAGAAPDPQASERMFADVARWLGQGVAPEAGPPVNGAAIEVRISGRVAARASVLAQGEADRPKVLAGAARSVLAQVLARPANPGVARDAWLREFWASATLTLELTGPLVPFACATYDELDTSISPGCFGLAVRAGERLEGVFPRELVQSNLPPGAALRSAIAKATGDATLPLPGVPQREAGVLARERGLTYYRFRTAQLTQLAPGGAPILLQRGVRLVDRGRIDDAELRAMAQAMARHLAARIEVRDGVAVLATPGPGLGESGGRAPGVLACAALAHYAGQAWADSSVGAPRVRDAGEALLGELGAEGSNCTPIEAALMVVLRDESGQRWGTPWDQRWERVGAVVRAAFDPATQQFAPDLPEPGRGLVAYALTILARRGEGGVGLEVAGLCVRGAFRGTSPRTLETQMPWLLWAEQRLAGPGGALPSLAALEELRDWIVEGQVRPEDAGIEDLDMVGGLVGRGSALPTWHSARPLCALAGMLGDSRLTPVKDAPRRAGPVLAGARFVRQLMVDEASTTLYLAALPEAVVGGIRSSPWESRLPGDATAFGLWTTCETLSALRGLAREAPAQAPEK